MEGKTVSYSRKISRLRKEIRQLKRWKKSSGESPEDSLATDEGSRHHSADEIIRERKEKIRKLRAERRKEYYQLQQDIARNELRILKVGMLR